MKNKHLFSRGKTWGMAITAVALSLFCGCADGFDEAEEFSSGVKNAQLAAPDTVMIAFSATGETAMASWPVVMGAGGYSATLLSYDDPTNPDTVFADKFVDGCSLSFDVKEDTNYGLLVLTLGNEKYGNKQAVDTLLKPFTTMVPTYQTIVADDPTQPVNLTEWFDAHPVPTDTIDELAYELVTGVEYTLPGDIDFGGVKVTLRGDNKVNHVKVKVVESGRFVTYGGFKIKFVDIDASEGTQPLFQLSKEPAESMMGESKRNEYKDPFLIQACNIKLTNNILYDNGVAYVLDNFLMKDCIVEYAAQAKQVIYLKASSYINMTFENSTIYSREKGSTYFAQVGGERPAKLTGYSTAVFTVKNCTFFRLAKTQNFVNWSRYTGQASVTLNLDKSIFVDCGRGGEMIGKMIGNDNMTQVYSYNTYYSDGSYSAKDKSKDAAAFEGDPGYGAMDYVPAPVMINGMEFWDFSVTGAEQLQYRTGDPRWLPAAEEGGETPEETPEETPAE